MDLSRVDCSYRSSTSGYLLPKRRSSLSDAALSTASVASAVLMLLSQAEWHEPPFASMSMMCDTNMRPRSRFCIYTTVRISIDLRRVAGMGRSRPRTMLLKGVVRYIASSGASKLAIDRGAGLTSSGCASKCITTHCAPSHNHILDTFLCHYSLRSTLLRRMLSCSSSAPFRTSALFVSTLSTFCCRARLPFISAPSLRRYRPPRLNTPE